jgi:methyl-accepting chemotaxis protein
VQGAEDALRNLAAHDMEFTLRSKQQVEQMMGALQATNLQIMGVVENMSGISLRVEDEVNTAVTALQFQDMSDQLLTHLQKRLQTWEKIGASAAVFSDDCDESQLGLQRAIQQCAAQLSSLEHVPVLQKNVNSGSVELF